MEFRRKTLRRPPDPRHGTCSKQVAGQARPSAASRCAASGTIESLIFDTTFLIDFQRERAARPGKAHSFLEENSECIAYLPIIAYGEFAEGFADRTDAAFLSVVESFELLPVTRSVADFYSRLARKLRAGGKLIGANDLWIAATAIEKDLPLVTRNTAEFAESRVCN